MTMKKNSGRTNRWAAFGLGVFLGVGLALLTTLGGCRVYTEPAGPPVIRTSYYTPQYYLGHVVFYDASGVPYIYRQGVRVYVPSTHPRYRLYVRHYHLRGPAYRRWYRARGRRYLRYRRRHRRRRKRRVKRRGRRKHRVKRNHRVKRKHRVKRRRRHRRRR